MNKIDNFTDKERDGVYLCQRNIDLEAGQTYDISFTVKGSFKSYKILLEKCLNNFI